MWNIPFSNSLIIHQVKTKEITTIKEVWIPGLNYHRFFFTVNSLVFVSIEKIQQTIETVFHRQSKHLEFRQKSSIARGIFNSLLGVWTSRWNTCLIYYLLNSCIYKLDFTCVNYACKNYKCNLFIKLPPGCSTQSDFPCLVHSNL